MKTIQKKDLVQFQKLAKHFHVAVLMRATYEPHPVEWIKIEDITERGQFTVVTKEPKK